MTDWLTTESNRRYHEVASLFPLMDGAEFGELKADIAANGLLEPIWLHPDGSIVDGRNRHRACIETETKPRFRNWDAKGSLVAFVVSLNVHRRHLTSGQKAACALDALPLLEQEAKARMIQGAEATNTGSQRIDTPQEEQGRATEKAAALFQTNRQYVSDAKRLQQEAPDLLQQVKTGRKSLPQAKRENTKRKKKAAPPLPSNKYRVWYVDPPWKYNDAGVIGETDNYGHAERHYPSMSIAETCAMGEDVKSRCASDAVLFLWTTSPMLEDAFKVVKAWGFKYKTSMVWDKVRHNYGHYVSVRHEFVLICTRGSCTPDVSKLFDSVLSIKRSDVHSEKPEEIREIIDTLYTHGKKIELFARKKVDGWDNWGNEHHDNVG